MAAEHGKGVWCMFPWFLPGPCADSDVVSQLAGFRAAPGQLLGGADAACACAEGRRGCVHAQLGPNMARMTSALSRGLDLHAVRLG